MACYRSRLATHVGVGYTSGMKTAISLPDDLFERADRWARRTKRSRSQLYADAVREYLARHASDAVTEAMDRVIDDLDQADAFTAEVARQTLERTEW